MTDVVEGEKPAAAKSETATNGAADNPYAAEKPPKSEKAPVSKVDKGEAAIRVKGVTKTFGLKNAVDDLSLVIPAGSVYGLIGPNGAGKTTTFSMMAGYLKPTKGTLEILGFLPDRVDELRGKLGVLPQDALLPASDLVGEFLVDMARLHLPSRMTNATT